MKYLYLLILSIFIIAAFAIPTKAQVAMWGSKCANVTNPSSPTSTYCEIWGDYAYFSYPYHGDGGQNYSITDDGNGGMIMCWMGYYYGVTSNPSTYYWCPYAQRVNAQGQAVWSSTPLANGGVLVGPSYGTSTGYGSYQYSPPVCASDGNGGAYIAWTSQDNTPSGTFYRQHIQHVSSTGALLWGNTGYILTVSGNYTYPSYYGSINPWIVSLKKDPNGGVLVSWYDNPSSGTWYYGTIHAAKINGDNGSSPNFVWGPYNVETLSSTEYIYPGLPYYNYSPEICTDNGGGAYVAFSLYTGSSTPYMANRIYHLKYTGSSTPTVAWNNKYAANPNYQSTSTYMAYAFYASAYNLMPDGYGGCILGYSMYYDPTYGYYAPWILRVNSAGGTVYGPKNAISTVSSGDYYAFGTRFTPDGAGGAYVAYTPAYSGSYTYNMVIQHVNGAGTIMWNPTTAYDPGISASLGTTMASYSVYYQDNGEICTDGTANPAANKPANLICSWSAYSNYHAYIQKFDSVGNRLWNSGSAIDVSTGSNISPGITATCLVSDNAGGAMIGMLQMYYYGHLLAQHFADTALGAHSTISSASIAAGNTHAGTTVTLTNALTVTSPQGSKPAQQLALKITGSSSFLGKVSVPSLPVTVNVGSSTQLNVNVTAPVGAYTDTLYLLTNDPLNPKYAIAVKGNGTYSRISSSDSGAMGNDHVGNPITKVYTIRNVGTDSLHITGTTITGNDPTNFSIIGNPVQAIAAGATGTITIGFTPSSAVLKTATLTINSDDSMFVFGGQPRLVGLSGTGIFPHFTSSANSIAFPYTVVTYRSSSRYLPITNVGTDTLHILSGTNFTGTNASEFNDTGNVFPIAIAPGATGKLKVTFSPLVTFGPRTATLNVVSDDSLILNRNPYPVQLSGTGVDGAPDFAYADIETGGVRIGKKDTTAFTFSNLADATKKLIITQMSVLNSFPGTFRVIDLPNFPDTILVGGSQTFHLEFTATLPGTLPADLHVTSNASDHAQDVSISGEGLKSQLSVASLSFGNVGIDTCATMQMKLTNSGSATLRVVSVTLLGVNSSSYSVVDTANNLTLPAGSFTNIGVMYCPTANGVQSIVARFITDFPDTIYTTIFGAGVTPGNLQASGAVTFGPVAIQQTLTSPLTIRNIGQTPVTIIDADIIGFPPVPFSSSLRAPVTVAAGDSITAVITFHSNTAGVKAATLKLRTSTGSGLNIALNAYASADPFAAYPLLLFNDTVAGNETQIQSVTVANFLHSDDQIVDLYVTGPGAAAYSIMHPLFWPYVVYAQGKDSVSVAFHPNDNGNKAYPASLIIKLQNGDSTVIGLTGVSKSPAGVQDGRIMPQQSTLYQNYPNPFSQTTTISYSIPERSSVTLTVYDQLGRTVELISAGMQDAGVYNVPFTAGLLPAGVYYYELRVNDLVQDRLMQIVK